MRIATWNVERPRPNGWKIPAAQRRRMAEVAADIWILNETHLEHRPGDEFAHRAFSPPHTERLPHEERWTAIWSRWPLKVFDKPAPHRRGTVAAWIETPSCPVIVYGTVIAWANEPHFDDGRPARMWEVHLAEIDRQVAEWKVLSDAHPGVPLIVAGDFNQDRDGSGWYGTTEARARVSSGLDDVGLVCITSRDAVEAGWLKDHHLVDHICVSRDLEAVSSVRCWEHRDETGQRLSDHPTVAADLQLT